MQGKELIMNALRGEKTKRTPWLPFVGCHGGKLINATATEYLSDAKLVVKGLNEAVKRYKPDGLPVMFDLQVEAEAMGCELKWADENPPAVVSHPLTEDPDYKKIALPGKEDGRIPLCLEATRQLRKDQPDIALYGLITGPFTLALHLLGSDIFMKMFEDPDYVYGLLAHCKEAGIRMADYYIEAGCDVVAVVDPMTSQIGPDQFEQFVTPPAQEIFAHVREKGAMSSFFVCGHAQQNIEVMCDTRPDNVCIDENIPLDYVKEKALPKKVSFGGNMKLTTVLLMGKPEDCQHHALECIETGGDTSFVLAPGCDLPYATPPENLEAVAQIVHDEYQRDVIRSMEQTEEVSNLIDRKSVV
jgi:MtaA/CmuA family methyltransferase